MNACRKRIMSVLLFLAVPIPAPSAWATELVTLKCIGLTTYGFSESRPFEGIFVIELDSQTMDGSPVKISATQIRWETKYWWDSIDRALREKGSAPFLR